MIQNLICKIKPLIEGALTTVNAVSQDMTRLVNGIGTDVTTLIDLVGSTGCTVIGSVLSLRAVFNAYKIWKERATGEDFTHNIMTTAFLFGGSGFFATISLIFF